VRLYGSPDDLRQRSATLTEELAAREKSIAGWFKE
jgi:hypothetical protein